MPFNNVTTIQDILDGRRSIRDTYPSSRGNWNWGTGDEDVDKSYREEGDDYKRVERDEEILLKMLDRKTKEHQEWRVKVSGGSKSFESFEMAQKYVREKGISFKYLSRVAQQGAGSNKLSVITDSLNKVFMVQSINVEKGVSETGSAFCIAPGYFLTCAHVIESYNKIVSEGQESFGTTSTIKLVQDDLVQPAELIEFDLKNDLAILKADIKVKPFAIGEEPFPGEEIIVIGSPHGYENNISTGTVGGLDREIYRYEGAPTYMFVDAAVFPGSSGGPVIRAIDGKVIGVMTLIISTSGEYGLNAALPPSYIKEFIAKYIS
jgi:S1-C subfamily serine protease